MNTQVVLITGGLTGIGRATALAFTNEGAQVVVSGRRDEEGQVKNCIRGSCATLQALDVLN